MAELTQRRAARVVGWCARECTRQRSGEDSVSWMFDGWVYAHRHRNHTPILRDVLALGRIVEPRHNMGGLRTVGVRVGWDVKLAPELVSAALDQLITAWGELDPVEWFRRYEEVHPFRDGNGRTGAILMMWHAGHLDDPFDAPNLWAVTGAGRTAERARVARELSRQAGA